MKKYTIPTLYRGQQIHKIICAKSDKQTSEILNTSVYQIKNYAHKKQEDNPFEGVKAYFDCGMLMDKEYNLLRKVMSYDQLKSIIDGYKDKEYAEFKKEYGIN